MAPPFQHLRNFTLGQNLHRTGPFQSAQNAPVAPGHAHFTPHATISAVPPTITPADTPVASPTLPAGSPPTSVQDDKGSPKIKVPRPPNAFILYRKHHHPLLKAGNPNLHNNEISIILGRQWKSETPETQARFKTLAENVKQEHQRAHPEYQYAPRKASEKKRRASRKRKSASSSQSNASPESSEAMRGVHQEPLFPNIFADNLSMTPMSVGNNTASMTKGNISPIVLEENISTVFEEAASALVDGVSVKSLESSKSSPVMATGLRCNASNAPEQAAVPQFRPLPDFSTVTVPVLKSSYNEHIPSGTEEGDQAYGSAVADGIESWMTNGEDPLTLDLPGDLDDGSLCKLLNNFNTGVNESKTDHANQVLAETLDEGLIIEADDQNQSPSKFLKYFDMNTHDGESSKTMNAGAAEAEVNDVVNDASAKNNAIPLGTHYTDDTEFEHTFAEEYIRWDALAEFNHQHEQMISGCFEDNSFDKYFDFGLACE
ncbi:MAG: hypothetical protein M1825_004545 [Sarcosagium campestre]|nr:MAG: hypothetical protein M1825_004545 [Sarcosagium campestre]